METVASLLTSAHAPRQSAYLTVIDGGGEPAALLFPVPHSGSEDLARWRVIRAQREAVRQVYEELKAVWDSWPTVPGALRHLYLIGGPR